jgi:GST-like protein
MPASQSKPIDLYFWNTPNGYKISIMLEELGVPYTTRFVDIGKGDQFKPEFLKISPNNRMPAIVDPEGPDGEPISIFESGAILIYLADKFGRFHGKTRRERVAINEWLFWQVANVGPAFGNYNYFKRMAPDDAYALKRFGDEAHRLYRVFNTQLEGRDWVAGDYSIADMSLFGWTRSPEARGIDSTEFPNVAAWIDRMAARPAVKAGVALKSPADARPASEDEQREVLYGQR